MKTLHMTDIRGLAEVRQEIYDETKELMAEAILQGGARLGYIPRPIDTIASVLGSPVCRAPEALLHGNQGLCTATMILVPDTDGRNWVKRFTIAHELGHQRLGHAAEEWECDAFAGSILIPMDDVQRELGHRNLNRTATLARWARYESDTDLITHLVRRYGVGYNAMIRALADYGWVVGVAPWTSVVYGDHLYEEYEYYYRRGRGG